MKKQINIAQTRLSLLTLLFLDVFKNKYEKKKVDGEAEELLLKYMDDYYSFSILARKNKNYFLPLEKFIQFIFLLEDGSSDVAFYTYLILSLHPHKITFSQKMNLLEKMPGKYSTPLTQHLIKEEISFNEIDRFIQLREVITDKDQMEVLKHQTKKVGWKKH